MNLNLLKTGDLRIETRANGDIAINIVGYDEASCALRHAGRISGKDEHEYLGYCYKELCRDVAEMPDNIKAFISRNQEVLGLSSDEFSSILMTKYINSTIIANDIVSKLQRTVGG